VVKDGFLFHRGHLIRSPIRLVKNGPNLAPMQLRGTRSAGRG